MPGDVLPEHLHVRLKARGNNDVTMSHARLLAEDRWMAFSQARQPVILTVDALLYLK